MNGKTRIISNPSPPAEKDHVRAPVSAAVWIFLAALLVQTAVVMQGIGQSPHFRPEGDDMRFYNEWARKILGELPWKPGEPNAPGTAFYGMPGYAYLLAAIYWMTGGYHADISPWIVAQVQAVVNAFTAVWVFLLGRRLFSWSENARRGNVIGGCAAVAWMLYTPSQVFSAIVMPTTWAVCAFWGLLLWLVRLRREPQRQACATWLAWGAVAGLAATLVASILMLLPLALLVVAVTPASARGVALRMKCATAQGMALFLGLAAGASPVWGYNFFVAKDTVLFSAHDGLNYFLGNNPAANGYPKIPAPLRASQEDLLLDSIAIPEAEAGRALKRSEVSNYWKERGRHFIREQPWDWLRLAGVKFGNFWNAYSYDDLSTIRLLRNDSHAPPGLDFGVVAVLGLCGLLASPWMGRGARWVALAVLFFTIAVLTTFVTERYRLPAVPGLLLLGAGGLWLLWEHLSRGAWGACAVQVAVLAGALWFVTLPRNNPALWSLDFYKAGILATRLAERSQGQAEALMRKRDTQGATENLEAEAQRLRDEAHASIQKAVANLERAFRYSPENANVNFALGNAWYHHRDLERAMACWKAALTLDPRLDRAHNNLAMAAIEQQRWGDAEKHLIQAARLAPRDAKTWFLLSQVMKEQGDLEKARIAIRRAIEIEPGSIPLQQWKETLSPTLKPQP